MQWRYFRVHLRSVQSGPQDWINMQTACYGFQIHTYNTLPVFGDRYFICKHSVGENIRSIQDTIVDSFCFFFLSKDNKIKDIFKQIGIVDFPVNKNAFQ